MPTISIHEAKQWGYPSNFFVQTILINKNIPKSKAIQWLNKHKYLHKFYRVAGQHMRFMQSNPVYDAVYYSRRITPDITIVYQKYK